jgi:hypothetical protein
LLLVIGIPFWLFLIELRNILNIKTLFVNSIVRSNQGDGARVAMSDCGIKLNHFEPKTKRSGYFKNPMATVSTSHRISFATEIEVSPLEPDEERWPLEGKIDFQGQAFNFHINIDLFDRPKRR